MPIRDLSSTVGEQYLSSRGTQNFRGTVENADSRSKAQGIDFPLSSGVSPRLYADSPPDDRHLASKSKNPVKSGGNPVKSGGNPVRSGGRPTKVGRTSRSATSGTVERRLYKNPAKAGGNPATMGAGEESHSGRPGTTERQSRSLKTPPRGQVRPFGLSGQTERQSRPLPEPQEGTIDSAVNNGWTTVVSKRNRRKQRQQRLDQRTRDVLVDDKYHRILTLNVNSIDDRKYNYLANFLKNAKNSVVAITELVSDQSVLNNLMAQHSRFPILNHNSAKRVGLMIPKHLESCFEIVDTFSVKQARKRKSTSVCQTTTFKFSYGKIIEVITVVYCAPDATSNSRTILRLKLL